MASLEDSASGFEGDDSEPAVDIGPVAIRNFIRGLDPQTQAMIGEMEGAEPWPITDPEINREIEGLFVTLSDEDIADMAEFANGDLLTILGNINVSRCLKAIAGIMAVTGAFASETEFLQKGSDAGKSSADANAAYLACVRRLTFLQRHRMLQRVYSPRRAAAIIEAIEDITS